MRNNLSSLVKRDSSISPFQAVKKAYKFLTDNPQLENLSFLSLSRISNIKSIKRQEYVIQKITFLIEHPQISDYRVMKIIQSSKGEDIDG